MTAISKQPLTKDFLSPLGFQFNILKAPAVNFFVQEVELPEISLNEADIPSPFVMLKFPGTQLVFGDLSVTFKVDERLQAYLEIQNWMRHLGFPDNFNQYAQLSATPGGVDTPTSDVSVVILSNQKNPIYTATFKDAFPINLSGLRFDATQPTVDYLVASARFAYTSYTIKPA